MKKEVRSADEMVNMLKEDNALLEKLKKEDTISVLEEIAPKAVLKADTVNAGLNDPFIYRWAIYVLGLLALLTAIGSIVLVFEDKPIPEVLVALGSAAVGALVGLFASPPTNK